MTGDANTSRSFSSRYYPSITWVNRASKSASIREISWRSSLDLLRFTAQAASIIIMKPLVLVFRALVVALLAVGSFEFSSRAASVETNSVSTPSRSDEIITQELMRTYLQLQEELHATQLAIDQTRKESQLSAARNAEALAAKLQSLENALSAQRARELEAMQGSNRVMIFMAGTFAVVGFVAMLLMAYFQWRTVHGLAEISSALPAVRALGPGPGIAALLAPNPNEASREVEQSNGRLLGVLEQLEKRMFDLERSSRQALRDVTTSESEQAEPSATRLTGVLDANGHGPSANPPPDLEAASVGLKGLLYDGQKLLDDDKPEAALKAFEEALAIRPEDAETLVKKGVALERLQKLDQAIACYDAAIQADSSLTIAYLHKGGVFNRLERFNEALECYEKALRTQEKRGI